MCFKKKKKIKQIKSKSFSKMSVVESNCLIVLCASDSWALKAEEFIDFTRTLNIHA